ncbi:TonB-dependent receptor [Robertkochia solimangrovi]|uniref:TonB-dependent receptor n=1 Tax=Robertkochia solimangrovi TaxID=2213046 RepID=UPI00117D07BC|nr:carboxypeptidase-like regulatory domain-containing protein [Robertkochia solimangrovi]TRZ41959.1 TonB-dependent receptor [Robertkochia solimangrovi]
MKQIFFILFFNFLYFGVAQESEPRISISIQNTALVTVIEEIEEKTDFHFYFIDQWLQGIKVTGDFRDTPVTEVIEKLLTNTEINFYVMDGSKVILTKNTLITDRLPENYFSKQEVVPENDENNITSGKNKVPQSLVVYQIKETNRARMITIGKEKPNDINATYNLRGTITGAEDGKPVSDLVLMVEGTGKGTTTDENGAYQLKLTKGPNIILTKGLGFKDTKTTVVIYSDGEYNLQLDESIESLDEVVVRSDYNKNVEDAHTGVITLDVENIKNIPLILGEEDIFKAALFMPGISTAGEGSAGYNVRGGKTDQNLILFDEGVIYNPAHFFGIFSAINPFSIGKATIYKGNIPVEYGGRLSSVFDIRSKKGNMKQISGEGSIGPVTGNLLLELPVVQDKSSIMVGGRATYSNWILRSLDDDRLKNSEASFFDLIGKFDQVINENNSIEATGYFSHDAYSVTRDSIYDYSNLMASLIWNHQFNTQNSLAVTLSHSGYGFGIAYDGLANNDFNLEYKNNESSLKIKMKSLLNEQHTLDYGLISKLYTIYPGKINPEGIDSEITALTIPKEKGLESALFLSDSYKFNDDLLFELGIRYSLYAALGPSTQRTYPDDAPKNSGTQTGMINYDNNEVIKTNGGPEVMASARYFLGEDFSVKASYNNTIQYIHTLSSNTTASPIDTWKLSDLNIEPQRSSQYSLGLYRNLDAGLYEISLEGYYKKQKNLLDYKVGAQLLLNEAIETEVLQGDGKAYGIELMLKKNEGKLNGWLAYSYSRSLIRLAGDFDEEIVNGGEYFATNYDKPHDLSIVANYKFTRRFSASANFVYQTGRPVTFPVGKYTYNNAEYVVYSDRNAYRIPDYYRLDLSFNMEGTHKIEKLAHSFWSFSIYNALGRNNPYSVFFVTEDGNIKAYQSSIFSIPVPTITYNFKF